MDRVALSFVRALTIAGEAVATRLWSSHEALGSGVNEARAGASFSENDW